MEGSPVDRLHADFAQILATLLDAGEISLQSSANDNLRKGLLLAAASHFEALLLRQLREFFVEVTDNNAAAVTFLNKKAVEYQYYTYFDWECKNANRFFSLFGEGFKAYMKEKRMAATPDLGPAISAFLEIGLERNRLVHQDYATFPLEKTSEEIYMLYRKALPFMECLPIALREWNKQRSGDELMTQRGTRV